MTLDDEQDENCDDGASDDEVVEAKEELFLELLCCWIDLGCPWVMIGLL